MSSEGRAETTKRHRIDEEEDSSDLLPRSKRLRPNDSFTDSESDDDDSWWWDDLDDFDNDQYEEEMFLLFTLQTSMSIFLILMDDSDTFCYSTLKMMGDHVLQLIQTTSTTLTYHKSQCSAKKNLLTSLENCHQVFTKQLQALEREHEHEENGNDDDDDNSTVSSWDGCSAAAAIPRVLFPN